MKTLKLCELVFDYALYPRSSVDPQHVAYMRESLRAGVTLPPFIADEKSKRVTDGFHRGNAIRAESGDDADVEVILRRYKSEADMFLDAARMNACHGRSLTTHDRAHCLIRAKELKITMDQIASALVITTEKAKDIVADRTANMRVTVDSRYGAVALKRTIAHMAGKSLTRSQAEANEKLSGMNVSFYANQLILLIENKLIDLDDEKGVARLKVLRDLLVEIV